MEVELTTGVIDLDRVGGGDAAAFIAVFGTAEENDGERDFGNKLLPLFHGELLSVIGAPDDTAYVACPVAHGDVFVGHLYPIGNEMVQALAVIFDAKGFDRLEVAADNALVGH